MGVLGVSLSVIYSVPIYTVSSVNKVREDFSREQVVFLGNFQELVEKYPIHGK